MPEERREPARSERDESPSRAGGHIAADPPRDGNGNGGGARLHGRRAYDVDLRTSSPAANTGYARVRRADDGDDRPAHAGVGPPSAAGRSSSWGPVLSGAATAFVVFLIFTTLWLGIAASGVEAVGENLEWFQLASGILAAAAGGAAAGWLDPRGTMTGMIQGLATWGLLVLAVTITGVAAGTALLGAVADVSLQSDVQVTDVNALLEPFQAELWALFAILMGGAVIAALFGAMTGRAHTMLSLDRETHDADDTDTDTDTDQSVTYDRRRSARSGRSDEPVRH